LLKVLPSYPGEPLQQVLSEESKILSNNAEVKPGQKNFMSLQELLDLISLSQLNSLEHFASGVPYFAFNSSMMTQVDELK
jgi:hypothetical protein